MGALGGGNGIQKEVHKKSRFYTPVFGASSGVNLVVFAAGKVAFFIEQMFLGLFYVPVACLELLHSMLEPARLMFFWAFVWEVLVCVWTEGWKDDLA